MDIMDSNIRLILDAIDAHTIIGDKSHIMLANKLAGDWMGISQDDLKSYSWHDLLHSSSLHNIKMAYERLSSGHESAVLRVLVRHPVLGLVWVDATIKPATFLDSGNYWLVTFVPLHILPSDINTTGTILGKNDPLLDKVYSLKTPLAENHFITTVLDDFLTILHNVIPYDSASLMLVEQDGMRLVTGRGLPDKYIATKVKLHGKTSISQSADLMYENQFGTVYSIGDVQQHEAWIPLDEPQNIRAWMGIELYHNQSLAGILNIDSHQPHFFTEDHARQALALSQQATLALVYARLYHRFYNEVEEHRRLQQVLVKNLINTETMLTAQALLYTAESASDSLSDLVNIISSSMDQTGVVAVLFHQMTDKLTHKIQSQILEIDAWDVFRAVYNLPDLPEGQIPLHDVSLPASGYLELADGKQVVAAKVGERGLLMAIREPESHRFDDAEYELVKTIASQISLALQNEMLNAQVKQYTHYLEQKFDRSESQLAVTRKRLKAILDSTAEGIFYMEDFKLQYANPAFCNMVGYELDELYGKPLSFVRVTPPAEEAQNFDALLENPLEIKPGQSETRLRHRGGVEFYASIRFSLVGQPGENPVRMVATARDISQERKLYIQRARFIANAAHELRTPLSSLILRLHMLRRQPERMENHLESLDKVTNYLKELVEELLTLSRFERGSIELEKAQHHLQQIIDQAVTAQLPFAEEQKVSVQLDMPDDPIEVTMDGTRIYQMMSNLVVNAINYSGEQDKVYILVRVEVDTVGNENAIIQIIDEGEGIGPDLLPDDIFEPFARPSGGKRKETGMGLALVKEIINLHGGSIYAISEPGEGATFRLSLPLN